MKYPYLLFDVDDTLFDFSKSSAQAFHILCRQENIPNTPETWNLYHTINMELWTAFDDRKITKEQVITGRFIRFLDVLGLHRDPDQCNDIYLTALGNAVYPLPWSEEVCRELSRRGHQLHIVTNAVASVQRNRLRACPFGDLFSRVFVSEEAGAAKPDRAYYEYVFSQVPELTHENCLVIGDSLTSDILGANNADLHCCWFNPRGKSAGPEFRIDYDIRDLRELLNIV